MVPGIVPHPEINTFDIGIEGVDKLLTSLKPHKAAGPDQLNPRVLKELHLPISPILHSIFQLSLKSGKVPADWKTANVVPVYKKGPKYSPSNYRPVSLTCVCCKLMEHIVASQVVKHLNNNKILNNNQHGFRAQRSCETQLIEFINDLHKSIDSKTQVDIVVMDFAKAFDKVSHDKLIYKLGNYGIRGRTLDWITDFLKDRSQKVLL